MGSEILADERNWESFDCRTVYSLELHGEWF